MNANIKTRPTVISNFNKVYYNIKPFIPRTLQLTIRRVIALYKRKKYADVWPIDPASAEKPENWKGWPDNKKFALVIQHDVDTQKGHDSCRKLMDIEKSFNLRSFFSFVPERYKVSSELLKDIQKQGFGLGIHGLKHDGKLFSSESYFRECAVKINSYMKEWGTQGFTSPSMHHNLDWMHYLNIKYSTSTFDTDPFEPNPEGAGTIFPYLIQKDQNHSRFIEIPYTLPQDHLLYVILREKNIDIWKKKLDWLVEQGGMALFNTHSDYMNFGDTKSGNEEYPVQFYIEFLKYVIDRYKGQYWHTLPGEVAEFWQKEMVILKIFLKNKVIFKCVV